MTKKIHPSYYEVEMSVIHKDGRRETFKCHSTSNCGKLVSEVDLSKHVAWVDAVVRAGESINAKMQKFDKRLTLDRRLKAKK